MLESLEITPIAITIIIIVGAIAGTKIFLSHSDTNSKTLKNRIKLMEENEKWMKGQIQKYKNKASNLERGPQIEGDLDNLGGGLHSILSEFGEYLPKWAQGLVKDPETSKMIAEYLEKNPEKLKQVLGKVVGKKGDAQSAEEEISV